MGSGSRPAERSEEEILATQQAAADDERKKMEAKLEDERQQLFNRTTASFKTGNRIGQNAAFSKQLPSLILSAMGISTPPFRMF